MPILDAIRKRWPWIKHFFADGAYDRRKLLDKAAFLDFVVEVVRGPLNIARLIATTLLPSYIVVRE
jgi:hypothetical protein